MPSGIRDRVRRGMGAVRSVLRLWVPAHAAHVFFVVLGVVVVTATVLFVRLVPRETTLQKAAFRFEAAAITNQVTGVVGAYY